MRKWFPIEHCDWKLFCICVKNLCVGICIWGLNNDNRWRLLEEMLIEVAGLLQWDCCPLAVEEESNCNYIRQRNIISGLTRFGCDWQISCIRSNSEHRDRWTALKWSPIVWTSSADSDSTKMQQDFTCLIRLGDPCEILNGLVLILASKPQCPSTLERETISLVTNIIRKYMVKSSVWTTCLFNWRGLTEANEWCRSWWSVADDIFHKYSHRDKEEEGDHIGITPKQSKWSETFGFMTECTLAYTKPTPIPTASRCHECIKLF